MPPPIRTALQAVALCLVLLAVTPGKPGLPLIFKGSEPTAYLAATSLALDRDLRCDRVDLERSFDEYPLAQRTVHLMAGTAQVFDVSWVYPVLAAPFARALGANGMVLFNMLLLLATAYAVIRHLAVTEEPGVAALFGAGFALASPLFAFVFRLQGEVLTAAFTALALLLTVSPAGPRMIASSGLRAAIAGIALALAAHDRPFLLLLALACWIGLTHQQAPDPVAGGARPTGRRTFVVALIVAGIVAAGIGLIVTGRPLGHLDQDPIAVVVDNPLTTLIPTAGAGGWPALLPPAQSLRQWLDNAGWFLVGRHTGWVPYCPFAVLAVLLFLFDRRAPAAGWSVLLALLLGAGATLLWLPADWQGGDDFAGNRYFLAAYPAFAFLLRRIPRWLVPVPFAAAGLFTGVLILAPLGSPMPYHDPQGHARAPALALFPVEPQLLTRMVDYVASDGKGLTLRGREDRVAAVGNSLWARGGVAAELWLERAEPADDLVFEVMNHAPGNVVELRFGGDAVRLEFGDDPVVTERRVTLYPQAWTVTEAGHSWTAGSVTTTRGRAPLWQGSGSSTYYLGAAVTCLGTTRELAADVYRLEWGEVTLPHTVEVGADFPVRVELANRSAVEWLADGPTRITLECRFAAADTHPVPEVREPLSGSVAPGAELGQVFELTAPIEPGCYTMTIEPVRERVSHFSARGAAPLRVEIEVVEPGEESSDE